MTKITLNSDVAKFKSVQERLQTSRRRFGVASFAMFASNLIYSNLLRPDYLNYFNGLHPQNPNPYLPSPPVVPEILENVAHGAVYVGSVIFGITLLSKYLETKNQLAAIQAIETVIDVETRNLEQTVYSRKGILSRSTKKLGRWFRQESGSESSTDLKVRKESLHYNRIVDVRLTPEAEGLSCMVLALEADRSYWPIPKKTLVTIPHLLSTDIPNIVVQSQDVRVAQKHVPLDSLVQS